MSSSIDYTSIRRYLSGKSVEELSSDRRIYSSLLLKRLVKPILGFKKDYEPPIWFYVAPNRDYIIVPETYCSCKDFIINVMSRKNREVCRHLVIQYLGGLKKIYREVLIPDMESYTRIIYEILDINISPTLRKLLYQRR
jgi:predicted nucleic acid-binding Zn finger protein